MVKNTIQKAFKSKRYSNLLDKLLAPEDHSLQSTEPAYRHPGSPEEHKLLPVLSRWIRWSEGILWRVKR